MLRSKKGFTLIELMVVVAIIGVLALLGLRLYTGQQQKAKNAIVKANAGTIQTLIQAELADTTSSEVNDMLTDATENLFEKSGIHIPDGGAQEANGIAVGEVVVTYFGTVAGEEYFEINVNSFSGAGLFVYTTPLTARK